MKNIILNYILSQKGQITPQLKKKIIWGVGLFAVCSFIFLGIAGFAVYKAAHFVTQKAQGVVAQVDTQDLNLNTGIESAQKLTWNILSSNCTQKLISLIHLEPWLTKPLSETLNSVHVACVEPLTKSISKEAPVDTATSI